MKTTFLAFAVVLLAVLAGGSLALAQPSRWLPPGSYQQSCNDIRFDGRTLTATCLSRGGRRVRTSLANPQRCRRDVANINGTLMCQ
jgi:hypothetical protein